MKREYEEAFAEVDEILQLMPVELLIKIPLQFRTIISENRSQYYKPNIKEPIEDNELKYETQAILGLIYRDFLVSPEERDELQKQDNETLRKFEEEMQQQYDIEKIFNKNKSVEIRENENNMNDLILYKKPGFVRKIRNLIKSIFSKKKI